jgi:hypothetical protein
MSVKPVVSSVVASRDYNPLTGDLDIVFVNGNKGRYKGVSSKTVDDFDSAESPGSFLSQSLKNIYSWERDGGE